MRESYGYVTPSLAERDRRWTAVREHMAQRDLDALVLFGWPYDWDRATGNARYLCPIGGNSEFNILVFPAVGDPIAFVLTFTMNGYWQIAQDWVPDVRPKRGPWATCVSDALLELGVGTGRIGLDGLAGTLDPDGWVPVPVFDGLRDALPGAEFVDLQDMMERIRCVKSDEELDFLRAAARLGDAMLAACQETAAPGVPEAVAYAAMREVMIAKGGEEPTLLLWAADAHPYPHPFRLPSTRDLERGDIILTEMHPRYAGYSTHLERTYSVGADPSAEISRIHDGCLAVFEAGMRGFVPGGSIVEAMTAVEDEMLARGLGFEELGIHGHGLGSLEYPRFRHHAREADVAAMERLGDDRFVAGMSFAFNIDLVDPAYRDGRTGAVFAETVVIGESGPEALHSTPRQILRAG